MGKDVIQQEILLISCSSYIKKQILDKFIPHLNTPQHLIDHLRRNLLEWSIRAFIARNY